MKITFYGHACIGIKVNGFHILVDPFITGNSKASHIDINTIAADYILLTHAHQDHILDVEAIAKRTNAVIVSNYEIASHFGNKGFNFHPMNHGGSWNFGTSLAGELAKQFGYTDNKIEVGLSAQQINSVMPETISLAPFDRNQETGESLSGENYITVNYAKLVTLLVAGFKEQQKEIEELKRK
jgi:ribonuclease BN (tRNA processing enzyme)